MLACGVALVADSAQFLAMSANACRPDAIGSAQAIQDSLGFLLTTFPIFMAISVYPAIVGKVASLLLPGPLSGASACDARSRSHPDACVQRG